MAMVDAQSDIEALYRADADRLWRAIYAFAGDPEIANDAVAEAYAQLSRRGSSPRPGGLGVAYRVSDLTR